MGFILNSREQISFIGYSLDDFVSKNAKCRFVVQLVSELDLHKLYGQYSEQGNDAFDPEAMLATWFFAYSEGVTSTRKLEECCKRDLHFIYASADLRPDHSSLSRFRKRHLHLLTEYFVQIIQRAREKGLTDFKRIAMDGSKIQASASPKRSKDADSLSRYLSAVREDIVEYMQLCEIYDDNEEGCELEEVRERLRRLQELERVLSERQGQLQSRKGAIKEEHQDKHKINITEPEALMMDKVNGRQKVPAYNAQISIDTETQLICANEVVQDRNDWNQFSRQYEKVENNLGADAEREYTTDAGYHSLEQLQYIEANRVDAVIAEPHPENRSRTEKSERQVQEETVQEKEKINRSDFTFNKEGDYYECPAGKRLCFERSYNRKGWKGRTYKAEGCENCALKHKCLPENNESGVRRIHRDDRERYAEEMFNKIQSEQGRERLKIRSMTVEPAFGNLKENLGFRRFNLRGLNQVRGEFNLMCIAHNINKMYILLMEFISLYCSENYYFRGQGVLRYKKLIAIRQKIILILLEIWILQSILQQPATRE